MASSPRAVVRKDYDVVPFGYGNDENADGVFFGPAALSLGGMIIGGTSMEWSVNLHVEGKHDSDCAALQFGFVQKITRLNMFWEWVLAAKRLLCQEYRGGTRRIQVPFGTTQ